MGRIGAILLFSLLSISSFAGENAPPRNRVEIQGDIAALAEKISVAKLRIEIQRDKTDGDHSKEIHALEKSISDYKKRIEDLKFERAQAASQQNAEEAFYGLNADKDKNYHRPGETAVYEDEDKGGSKAAGSPRATSAEPGRNKN